MLSGLIWDSWRKTVRTERTDNVTEDEVGEGS